MKSNLYVLISIVCLGVPALGVYAAEVSTVSCEVESQYGLSDEQWFNGVYSAYKAAVSPKSSDLERRKRQAGMDVENPLGCQVTSSTLGGYHGVSQLLSVLFIRYGEWRGGRAGSELVMCNRIVETTPYGRSATHYACQTIAKNRNF